jgi:hypothetical protein
MAGPTEHPLERPWKFWALNPVGGSFEVNPVALFSTVESFWQWWNAIFARKRKADDLRGGSIAIFAEPIRPAWEDKQNGSRIRLRVRGRVHRLWKHLSLLLIGGMINEEVGFSRVTGLMVTMHPNLTTPYIEIWLEQPQPNDQHSCANITSALREKWSQPFGCDDAQFKPMGGGVSKPRGQSRR